METHISDLYSAAPFIQQFQGQVFVIKIGGDLLQRPAELASMSKQIQVLYQIGVRPLLVHGAGPQLDAALKAAGHEPTKVQGRRVTDKATLDLAVQTFKGSANATLVSSLIGAGVPALGLSGADGRTLNVRRRPPVDMDGEQVDFGFVGDPVSVNPSLLNTLLGARFVPAVCSLGADQGGQLYNVNADTVAAELAVGLKAAKLIFVTDKPGILHDPSDDTSVYSILDLKEVEQLRNDGVIAGGMSPKVTAAQSALKRGVAKVHIVGSNEEDALLEEVFTNQGAGTMLVEQRESNGNGSEN